MNEKLQSLQKEAKAHREKLKQAGLSPDQIPEELRKHVQALDEQLRSIGGEQEATKKDIREAEKKLSTLAAESKCPLCLQTLSDDYKTDLLSRLNKVTDEDKRQLIELQKNLDEF